MRGRFHTRRPCLLGSHDSIRLRAALHTRDDVEFDDITLLKALITLANNRAVVDKDVGPNFGL